jgi:PAS domain S-box-containing protein
VVDTVAQNIQRKRAEEALRESEARFRIFFERSADPMTLLDPQTFRYVEVNEAAAQLIGASDREAVRGASPVERWPERQSDGRLSVERAREMVQLSLTQGSHRFEWLSRRYDGGELPLDIVMTAVPFGERTLISLVYRDIRAQKRAESEIRQLNMSLEKRVAERTIELARSEEKFRALFQGTSQAIVLHDETGAIVDANPSWLRLLGYSSLEDVLGKRPPERSAPIQPSGERAEALVRKHMVNALATGSTQHEWIMLRHDGAELPVEVFLTRIDLGGRRLLQAIFNDITTRKRAQAELHESEMRLRESEDLDYPVAINDNSDNPAQKWVSNESILASLTGCFRPAIKKFVETHRSFINQANNTHGLGPGHNRGKARTNPDAIPLLVKNFKKDALNQPF